MMRVQAIGLNSTVELFDHHLVIKRHPGFLEASATELLVPLINIVSVQFRRPALFTSGRLIIALQGAAQPKRTSYERRTDQTSIAFDKGQLAQFEEVLRVIRMAIATPSIEQLAMVAAQRHAVGERVGQAPREPTQGQLQRIDAAPEQSYIIDADVRASGEGTGNARASHQAEAPPNSDSGSFRKALGRAGTFVLIGVILLLLLTMLTGPSENVVVTPADPSADGAELANASAQDPSATSADQMLSQWAEFVTGQAGAEGFGLTDGDGHPGQFCSSTTGKRMFHFGGMGLGATNGIPIYDFFAFADGHSMDVGAFWFDRTRGTLLARNLLRDKSPQAKSLKVPNRTMTVTQIAPGIVEIGGIQYHSCVL